MGSFLKMRVSRYFERIEKEKIVILIPFWMHHHLNSFFGRRKGIFNNIKKLIPRDFGFIHYDFSSNILSDNPE